MNLLKNIAVGATSFWAPLLLSVAFPFSLINLVLYKRKKKNMAVMFFDIAVEDYNMFQMSLLLLPPQTMFSYSIRPLRYALNLI
jgi:hypothetical protein